MVATDDTNEEVWKSDRFVAQWLSSMDERERKRADQFALLARLLPFGQQDQFTFLDLGAGTGAASRTLLTFYPRSRGILADYSSQMMGEGTKAMAAFNGRYEYVEFDMRSSDWPAAIPSQVDAAVTSLCVHHLPDERKQSLFREIFQRLKPGGWYLNFETVKTLDPEVEAVWERVTEELDPSAARKRTDPTHEELIRHENHVRYMIDLDTQVGMLREAGFAAIDVYWKQLDFVIYGGYRR